MGHNNKLQKHIKRYVDNTVRVRKLSSIDVLTLKKDTEYAEILRENFAHIRSAAEENRRILRDGIFPLFHADRPLTREEIEALDAFRGYLLDVYSNENLDLEMTSRIADCQFADACKKEDVAYLVTQLDARIEIYYALACCASRITCDNALARRYAQKGEEAFAYIRELIAKDRFGDIQDLAARERIMVDYRYMMAVFEGITGDARVNSMVMEQYAGAMAMMEDPYYRDVLPDFDWKYNEERLLEYYATISECGNRRGFTEEQLKLSYVYTEKLREKWYREPEYYSELITEGELRLLVARNRYFQGLLTREEYKKELLAIYELRDPEGYALKDVYLNLLVPAEYLDTVQGTRLSAAEESILLKFYRNSLNYARRLGNSSILTTFLNYYVNILDRFIEVSGEFTFEEMCIESFATIHPPTYIHSIMVARFAHAICSCLLEKRPELFVGVLDLSTAEAVSAHKREILHRVYHAAMVHDIGKLAMIDTVIIYGRNLVDAEYEIIRKHPQMGYHLALNTCLDTYKDIILAHHRFYNEQGGYPAKEDEVPLKDKILIDIITIADCMDAATDSVGRSYARGKTLEEFTGELVEGAGTRYSPAVVACFADPALMDDLRYLVSEGRNTTYSDTYHLLVSVAAKGERAVEELDTLEEFRAFLKKKAQYQTAIDLLDYDLETAVPEQGVEAEAQTITMLAMEQKAHLTGKEAENLFRRLARMEISDTALKKSYELLRRQMDEMRRVPDAFYAAYVQERTIAQKVWETAKKNSDFALFAPHLERIIALTRQYCGYIDSSRDSYDVLLDRFEKGMDSRTIEAVFDKIRAGLKPLLAKIRAAKPFDDSILAGHYDIDAQKQVTALLLEYIGFDFRQGQTAESVHPFTTRISWGDVRLTNSYTEDDAIGAMFSAIHEGGHAIFDQSIDSAYFGTEVERVDMMGLHESQSRFFENILGRNIHFWEPIYGRIQELLPKFREISLADFQRAINHVHPSLVRVDADEVTYCLHIILRFEMEKAIFRDNVPVAKLPQLWNQKSMELLGIAPTNDSEGILQDIHWSDGSFGYFPAYLLGSVYDGMLLKAARRDLGDIDALLASGQVQVITAWLRENIHRHGSLYDGGTMLQRVCGEVLEADSLLEYFNEKYTQIYGLE